MRIQSTRVYTGSGFAPLALVVENGKFCSVEPYGLFEADRDYGNLRIVPGFLDLHTHGGYGVDTMDGDPKGFEVWAKGLLQEGVTSFLPTTVTASEAETRHALLGIAAYMEAQMDGAEVLGVHLEGPFLNPERKGAHPEEHLQDPDIAWFEEMQNASHHNIRLMTMAPEFDPGFEVVHACVKDGVRISAGHSDMSYEEMVLAHANGVTSATHVYNGMNPFHHRHVGMIGSALVMKDLYSEVIADGIHSSKEALRLFFQSKGEHRAMVVSDSLRAKGIPSSQQFTFAGHLVHQSEEGGIRDVKDGTLCGSSLKINEGLRLLVEEAMVPFESALNACTINPAEFLGIDDRKGSLTVGKDADFVVLADDYSVAATCVRGILHEFE